VLPLLANDRVLFPCQLRALMRHSIRMSLAELRRQHGNNRETLDREAEKLKRKAG